MAGAVLGRSPTQAGPRRGHRYCSGRQGRGCSPETPTRQPLISGITPHQSCPYHCPHRAPPVMSRALAALYL